MNDPQPFTEASWQRYVSDPDYTVIWHLIAPETRLEQSTNAILDALRNAHRIRKFPTKICLGIMLEGHRNSEGGLDDVGYELVHSVIENMLMRVNAVQKVFVVMMPLGGNVIALTNPRDVWSVSPPDNVKAFSINGNFLIAPVNEKQATKVVERLKADRLLQN